MSRHFLFCAILTKEVDRKPKNVGGEDVNSYITIGGKAEAYYNIDAYERKLDYNCNELRFKIYNSGNEDAEIAVFVDGVEKSTLFVRAKDIPHSEEIIIGGGKQVQFVRTDESSAPVYIIDAMIW